MAVKLRLQRTGHRNHTQFRVVATDKRRPRDGGCIEVLGWCDPHGKSVISEDLNLERVEYWKSVGAEVSHPVKQIIRRVKNRTPEAIEAEKVRREAAAKAALEEKHAAFKKSLEEKAATAAAEASASAEEATAEAEPEAPAEEATTEEA